MGIDIRIIANNVYNQYGVTMVNGTTYRGVDDNFAQSLIGSLRAVAVTPSQLPVSNAPFAGPGIAQLSLAQQLAGVASAADPIGAASKASATGVSIVGSTPRVSKYARSRAAYAGVKAKTGFMKIVLLGDSTMAGIQATGTYPNPVEGCRPYSYTPAFTAAMSTADAPAIDAAICGDQNVSPQLKQDGVTVATVADYDLGRTAALAAGWSSLAASNVLTLGGNMINGSGSNSFQFRPFELTDTMEAWVRVDTGLSTNWNMTRAVTNESLLLQTSVGTAGFEKRVLKCAAPTINFWKFQRVSGGGNLFLGILDAYDSTKPSVRVFNAGWSGSRTSDWKDTTSPWSPLNALIALNPDLVIIQPGINEYNNAGDQTGSPSTTVGGQFPATFQADLETICTALDNAGIEVILNTFYPSQNSNRGLIMQKTYRDVILAVGLRHGYVVNDRWTKLGTWEQVNNAARAGMADALHPNTAIYTPCGTNDAAMVRAIMEA